MDFKMTGFYHGSRFSGFKQRFILTIIIFFLPTFSYMCLAQKAYSPDAPTSIIHGISEFSHPTSEPATWVINKYTVFNEFGEPANSYVKDLLDRLRDSSGFGMTVSFSEFYELLESDEASVVYTDKLVKYATPKSIEIQKNDHAHLKQKRLQEEPVRAGILFHQTHDSLLAAVQEQYNVHRKDIVAILMWESNLGKNSGDYQIFNIFMGQILFLDLAYKHAIETLTAEGDTTLFDEISERRKQKRRLKSIRKRAVENLYYILRLAKQCRSDPLSYKGSWGGAIGFTQFMPFRLGLAIDGDNNGKVNLYTWPDAIHSIANYLHYYNYRSENKKRRYAIYRYNPMKSYVDGVMLYADTVWKEFEKLEAAQ